MTAMLNVPEILLLLVVAGIGLVSFAFWLWMLVHSIANRGLTDSERLIWVLLIVLVPLIGCLLYLVMGFPKRGKAAA